MYGTAGFIQLHSQSADIAELMRRMTSPLTPRGRTAKASTSRPKWRSVIGDQGSGPIVQDL
jgi:hypothetical protein